MRVNIKEVEDNVAKLVKRATINLDFIYDLLLAYGKPPASITRLKNGTYNLAKDKNTEIYWKNNLFFKYVEHEDLHSTIDDFKGDSYITRHNPRFIIVTDFKQLLALDTKEQDTLDIPISEIDKHFAFLLPWAGMEKHHHQSENIADIRAAERMAKLYDEIIKDNSSDDPMFYHGLNVFFSRLLFCFFAEDTEVFVKGQFTNSIASHTQNDGSDLNTYLDELFIALDIEDKTGYSAHIGAFPYVNGGLFNNTFKAPNFSSQARKLMLECGELNWAQINPDIFGSMIQAVVHPGQRAGLGMHYTSVVNIKKTIEPLFLDELLEEFNKASDDKIKLAELLHRIYKIKVFDPACGSGNFLIIAYKELRKLEHRILERLLENRLAVKINSGLKLENFSGIEIDDFAHEVAILSLWLAKHQMNIEFKQKFGKDIPLIPLKDTGNIVNGNATRLEWSTVCGDDDDSEIYLISNPPYSGSSLQLKDQKDDMQLVFSGIEGYKNLDYIACWFKKGADFVEKTNSQLAFVSTNSICQGEQVALLWPYLLKKTEIGFAYQSFKWSNNAKGNAGVTCAIVSLRKKSNKQKYIFTNSTKQLADNINPYLASGINTIVTKRTKPISGLAPMSYGSKPVDGGNLILTTVDKDKLIYDYPAAEKYVKRFLGADELIYGTERWCLWITDKEIEEAQEIPPILSRIEAVRAMRVSSKKKATKDSANVPYKFGEIRYRGAESIIIPSVTSEERDYIPIDYLDKNTVVSNRAHVVLNSPEYIFGVLTSRMHMVWTKSVAGRLETRINYSSTICYNNFPFPKITDKQKQMITNHVYEVLNAREHHSENTLAEMYKSSDMPEDLRQAHNGLDEVIELCYRAKPFDNDEDRLAYLFKLYETMIASEKEKN